MRKFIRFLLWVVAILAVLALVALLFLSQVIKFSFNSAAPALLGVPAKVETVHAGLLRGRFVLENLEIGNPEGFKTPQMLEISKVVFDVNPASIFTDCIQIREVTVEGFHLTVEQGLRNNNLLTLVGNLSSEEKKEEKEKPEKEKTSSSKRVEIDTVDITDTRMNFAMTAMMGKSVPVPLPPIHLKDIGKEKGGVTPLEAILSVFEGILMSVNTAISSAAGTITDTLGIGMDALGNLGSSITGMVSDISSSAVGTVKSVSSTAVGAMQSAGSSAVGAVQSVASGAAGLVGGLTHRSADAAESAGESVEDAKEAVGDAAENAKETVSDAAKSAGDTLSDAGDKAKEGLKEAGESIQETFSGAKESLGNLFHRNND